MSDFIVAENGDRLHTPEAQARFFQGYLEACGDAIVLRDSPLRPVILRHRSVLIEADTPFVFNSHLKTALARRGNRFIAYRRIDPDTLTGIRFSESPERQGMVEQWDPLIIDAFSWPTRNSSAASDAMKDVCTLREQRGLGTIIVTRNFDEDIPSSPDWFNPLFHKWLEDHRAEGRLTVASLVALARDKEKVTKMLKENPGLNRVVRVKIPDYKMAAAEGKAPGGAR